MTPAADEPEVRTSRAPRVPFALLVTGLIVGALALLLALNTASAANELRRHDYDQKDQAVSARLEQLRAQVAASGAPDALARAAGALGMVPAGNPAFVVIGKDGKARVMGRPGPVTAPPVPQPSTPKPSPTKTKSKSKSKSASKTTSKSASKTKSKSTSRTPRRGTARQSPTPKPTPTPTVSLPGGDR